MKNAQDQFRRAGTLARPYSRRVLCAAALLPVFLLVHFAAYWLRFEGELGPRELHLIASTILYATCVKLVVFGWFRVYQSWSR